MWLLKDVWGVHVYVCISLCVLRTELTEEMVQGQVAGRYARHGGCTLPFGIRRLTHGLYLRGEFLHLFHLVLFVCLFVFLAQLCH